MYLFRLLLFFSFLSLLGCEDDPVEPEPTDDPETPTYFWKAKIDGVDVMYEVGVDEHILAYITFSNEFADGDSINLDPGSGISSPDYFDNGYGQVDFMGNKFKKSTYEADKATALASFFTVGEHPFIETFFPDTPGINVRRDINDVQWMTLYAEQPETAHFTVTESVASTSTLGIPARRVKGTFNCVIFNSDGESKTLEEGSFYLEFQAP